MDESPPSHGAHAQSAHVQSAHAQSAGEGGGVAHAGGYGAHAGHAAYPGERAYGDGRDRGGWDHGDRPPPPEGWGHGGHAHGGFDAGARGGHEHQYVTEYHQHGYHKHAAHAAHAAHAQGYDADRDPRLRRRRERGGAL